MLLEENEGQRLLLCGQLGESEGQRELLEKLQAMFSSHYDWMKASQR